MKLEYTVEGSEKVFGNKEEALTHAEELVAQNGGQVWVSLKVKRARRLGTVAKWLNENTSYAATVEEGYNSGDRTAAGYVYVTSPGKGQTGNELVVRDEEHKVVLRHNSVEAYRCNADVEGWVVSHCGLDEDAHPWDVKGGGMSKSRYVGYAGTDPSDGDED